MIFTSNKKAMLQSFCLCLIIVVALAFTNSAVSAQHIKADSIKNQKDIVQKDSITWSANGHIKMNKDKSIITLNGNAKFTCNTFNLSAEEIVYKKEDGSVFAKNFLLQSKTANEVIKGSHGTFFVTPTNPK